MFSDSLIVTLFSFLGMSASLAKRASVILRWSDLGGQLITEKEMQSSDMTASCHCSSAVYHLHLLHLGFVHPLQDVALHQCLPSSSVCCFPNPGGSLLLCYVILPSSAWSSSRLNGPLCHQRTSKQIFFFLKKGRGFRVATTNKQKQQLVYNNSKKINRVALSAILLMGETLFKSSHMPEETTSPTQTQAEDLLQRTPHWPGPRAK